MNICSLYSLEQLAPIQENGDPEEPNAYDGYVDVSMLSLQHPIAFILSLCVL